MRYWVYDEEGNRLRGFQYKKEALAFLQPGWTIKVIQKRDGYSEMAQLLGSALL